MWQLHNIEAKLKHRRTLQTCARCGFYYPKIESTCHHCSEMTDEEVLRKLAQKKHFRVGLGKGMFIGALLILLIMYYI